VDSLLQWLLHVSPATLYSVICATAAVENLFPPFPSDVVVAFGSFVAAQGPGTATGVFPSTWAGNVCGAMLVYALGRRYGAERLERRLAGKHAESGDARIRAMFHRYGMPAVFVSRFVPGVRALVPAFAGALKLNPWSTAAMIASASALWYGLITWIAFRVGADWPHLRAIISRYSSTAAIVGTIILVMGIAAWLFFRKRRTTA